MKLRNKKTGEIADLEHRGLLKSDNNNHIIVYPEGTLKYYAYNSLAELNEEWEDYHEEPKEYWFISDDGYICDNEDGSNSWDEFRKRVGNYFSSKEEAEKAVEKLKALKQLKDNGMRIYSFKKEKGGIDLDFYTLTILAPRDKDSLDLLFGGEE